MYQDSLLSYLDLFRGWSILPQNISTYGSLIDDLLIITTIIIVPVTLIAFLFLIYFMIRGFFNKESLPYRVSLVTKIVFLIDIIVLILDLIIFNYTLVPWNIIQGHLVRNHDEGTWVFPIKNQSGKYQKVKDENVLEIKVEAKQFSWSFYYPGKDNLLHTEDDVHVNYALHIPVDTKIVLHITSIDVIHNFWVRVLRFKQDAIPGRLIRKWFEIDSSKIHISDKEWHKSIDIDAIQKTSQKMQLLREKMVNLRTLNTEDYKKALIKMDNMRNKLKYLYKENLHNKRIYEIICAEMCGNSHYSMNGWLVIHKKYDFEKWLKNYKNNFMNDF